MPHFLLYCLRDEIALRLETGAKAAEIQDELIESAPGPSEEQPALFT